MALDDAQKAVLTKDCEDLLKDQNELLMSTVSFEQCKDPIAELMDDVPDGLVQRFPNNVDEQNDAKYFMDVYLMSKGFLGKYLTVEYCPIKEFANLEHANVAVACKFVRDKFNANNRVPNAFHPSDTDLPPLSASNANYALMLQFTTTMSNLAMNNAGTKQKTKPDPAASAPIPKPLKENTDKYPKNYKDALPPLGTDDLDQTGYAKVKELSKTISSKLSINTILDRFAKWATNNNLRYTDDGYKILLATVLPDAHIKHYEHLAADPAIPFHHLAWVLSTRLSGKKVFHIAREQGQDLTNNISDPPVKVLEDLESLFNNVTGQSRERLTEEGFLLAEAYLKKRFGPTFWALFHSRLQSENIKSIASLIILFRNDFMKLASSYDDDKVVQKKNTARIHNIEENITAQGSISEDVKEIKSYLSHLDPNSTKNYASNPYPSVTDSGSLLPTSVAQASYCMAHHVAPAQNQAQAQAPAPVFVPVVVPGGNPNTQNGFQNQGYRRPNSRSNRQNAGFSQQNQQNRAPRSAGNRFNVPLEKQYCSQSCCLPGHYAHKNRDCHIQNATPCTYNYRHNTHMASNCIRSKDHSFGAVQGSNPNQGNPNASGGNQATGPRARLQAPPQAPPVRDGMPHQLNNLMRIDNLVQKVESHLASCSGAASTVNSA